uniref:Uncharacterized protein n=1 Tax=Onchocerca volvulus TaxID=6282 RepID=A0A8R1TS19_ONCVO
MGKNEHVNVVTIWLSTNALIAQIKLYLTKACECLMSDPDEGMQSWQPNSRGTSYVFGVNVLKYVCEKLSNDLVPHQVYLIRRIGSQEFFQKKA